MALRHSAASIRVSVFVPYPVTRRTLSASVGSPTVFVFEGPFARRRPRCRFPGTEHASTLTGHSRPRDQAPSPNAHRLGAMSSVPFHGALPASDRERRSLSDVTTNEASSPTAGHGLERRSASSRRADTRTFWASGARGPASRVPERSSIELMPHAQRAEDLESADDSANSHPWQRPSRAMHEVRDPRPSPEVGGVDHETQDPCEGEPLWIASAEVSVRSRRCCYSEARWGGGP